MTAFDLQVHLPRKKTNCFSYLCVEVIEIYTVEPLITDTSNKERKSYSPNRLHTVPDKSLDELQLTYTSYNGQNLNSLAVSVIRGSTVYIKQSSHNLAGKCYGAAQPVVTDVPEKVTYMSWRSLIALKTGGH